MKKQIFTPTEENQSFLNQYRNQKGKISEIINEALDLYAPKQAEEAEKC